MSERDERLWTIRAGSRAFGGQGCAYGPETDCEYVVPLERAETAEARSGEATEALREALTEIADLAEVEWADEAANRRLIAKMARSALASPSTPEDK